MNLITQLRLAIKTANFEARLTIGVTSLSKFFFSNTAKCPYFLLQETTTSKIFCYTDLLI